MSSRQRRVVEAIALCSDAMSEGLNLQGAAVIVHLDLPTTLRVAEQRVGRVDRMDTRHDTIEAWWPRDGTAFATRANERLALRIEESNSLLGSNLPMPDFREGGFDQGSPAEDDAVVSIEALQRGWTARRQSPGTRSAMHSIRYAGWSREISP